MRPTFGINGPTRRRPRASRASSPDGSTLERDVEPLMTGPAFEPLKRHPDPFRAVRVEGGTVEWPNGADLCPDVLIWNGPPPQV